jgi:hypothetical protein
MVNKILTGNPPNTAMILQGAEYERQAKHVRKHIVPFEFRKFATPGLDGFGWVPTLVIDDDLIPTTDPRAGELMDWSFQASGMIGHPMLFFDLKADWQGQESHFAINFCPLEYAGNVDLNGQLVELVRYGKAHGGKFDALLLIGKEFDKKITGKPFGEILDMVVNKSVPLKMTTIPNVDITPFILTAQMIYFESRALNLKTVKDLDNFYETLINMSKLKQGYCDPTILCPSCDRIYTEMRDKLK